MKHSWERNGENLRCGNCGIEVTAWRVKRGGLPECDGSLIPPASKRLRIAHCLDGKHGNPVMSCFNCPARINDKMCEKLRGV